MTTQAYDVFLHGKKIDTVFDEKMESSEVKRSLIGHDGYDSAITVRKTHRFEGPKIETKMDKLGGFYAADVTNKIIMYAYPTSIHACAAVKSPAKVAESMLSSEMPIAFESRPRWYQDRWDRMRLEMLNA